MKPSAHILVVEDETTIADNICYALQKSGFTVMREHEGLAALAIFEKHPPDLILLDIGLPDIDGFEVCRRVRKHSNIPILFLTARSEEIDRVVGLELGADDYICKPFSPRELVARVKANLRRVCPPNESNIHSGSDAGWLSINPKTRTVLYMGEAMEVTRYEFGILALLLDNPKRVFTRETLLERIWNEPQDRFDRVVDTHIKTLRAKLRTIDPTKEPIKTHRGVGYSWEGS